MRLSPLKQYHLRRLARARAAEYLTYIAASHVPSPAGRCGALPGSSTAALDWIFANVSLPVGAQRHGAGAGTPLR